MAYHDTVAPAALPTPTRDPYLSGNYMRPVWDHTYTYIIPPWLDDALVRYKQPTAVVAQFAQLRPLLSIQDLALLEATQRFATYCGPWLQRLGRALNGSLSVHNFNQTGITTVLDAEWATINTLSYTQKDAVLQSLALPPDLDPLVRSPVLREVAFTPLEDGGLYHRFEVTASRLVFIHFSHGILLALQDRAYAFRFVSDYLKVLYGLDPICEVAATDVFLEYLTLL